MLIAKILRSFTFIPAWKSFHLQIAWPIYRLRSCWIQQSLSLAVLSTFTLRKHLWCCSCFFLKLLVKKTECICLYHSTAFQPSLLLVFGKNAVKKHEISNAFLSMSCFSLASSILLHLTDLFFNNFHWVAFLMTPVPVIYFLFIMSAKDWEQCLLGGCAYVGMLVSI